MYPNPTALDKPIYDIKKSYLENAANGPFFSDPFPQRKWPPKKDWIDFLGYKIATPIGIPAGPLLNSKWIYCAANLGFDLLWYKTIRSHEHPGHPVPNIIYVEDFDSLHPPAQIKKINTPPETIDKLAITNSFGMPSRSQLYLKKDIPLSNNLVREGQVVIVSIVGTPSAGNFIEDFVETAIFAKECGAKIVEANFSCPNVTTGEGDIATNPDSVYTLASKLVEALGETPLIIKVGTFKTPEQLRETLFAAARAGVRAVSGINTISMRVVDQNGTPALGTNRMVSGICGAPIRAAALDFIKNARRIINQECLKLELIASGGITLPEHFTEFFNAGADIATTATGMMWDPYIAMKYHGGKP